MTSYDIFHRIALNWMIPAYFFLGGLSAGLFFVAVIINNWKREYKALALPVAILSPLCLAAGMGLLTLDLGHPLGFWKLLVTFQPSSAASWGVWGLSVFGAVSAAYAFFLFKGKEDISKVLGYIGLPFAIFTATYTGVLLAQMQGMVLWHTALLPWIFLVGAGISGLAFTILIAIATGKTEELGDKFFSLGKTLTLLIIIELGMIFTEVLILFNGGTNAAQSAKVFLMGEYSFLFWGIEIFLGAAIPFLIFFKSKKPSLQSVAATLVLIGVYAMRFIVVMAGQV